MNLNRFLSEDPMIETMLRAVIDMCTIAARVMTHADDGKGSSVDMQTRDASTPGSRGTKAKRRRRRERHGVHLQTRQRIQGDSRRGDPANPADKCMTMGPHATLPT